MMNCGQDARSEVQEDTFFHFSKCSQGRASMNAASAAWKVDDMFLTSVLTLLLIRSALSAEYFFGRCPSAPPMKDFDVEKFVGFWYIVEAFDHSEKCMTWNITKGDSPGTWKIKEEKENGIFNSLGMSHSTLNSATLSQPDQKNPAKMTSFWRISALAGSTAFTVHDTDYDTYAGVFECQNVGFFHRENGFVLSRTPLLRVDLRQMARLYAPKINVAYYRRVLQGNCKYRQRLEKEKNETGIHYGDYDSYIHYQFEDGH